MPNVTFYNFSRILALTKCQRINIVFKTNNDGDFVNVPYSLPIIFEIAE